MLDVVIQTATNTFDRLIRVGIYPKQIVITPNGNRLCTHLRKVISTGRARCRDRFCRLCWEPPLYSLPRPGDPVVNARRLHWPWPGHRDARWRCADRERSTPSAPGLKHLVYRA
jgi:hypothetical protein